MSIFIILLFCIYTLLIVLYAYSWIALPTTKTDRDYIANTRISIIVPARNEQTVIISCINSILQQVYPAHLMELIVINDHSQDNTLGIIKGIKDERLHIINLEDEIPNGTIVKAYKKKAIEIAVQQCSGDWIITTDADCIMCEYWLLSLVQAIENHKVQFIAAPVDMLTTSIFGIFQRLDFITMQGITGASIYKRMGNMCNGANLAYSKNAFIQVGGFANIDTTASGDDMLLMEKIKQHYPNEIMYLKNPEAIVYTYPEKNILSFLHQRIRWAGKSKFFKDKITQLVLLMVYVLNIIIFGYGIYCIVYAYKISFFLELIAIKTGIELILLIPVSRFFKQYCHLLLFFPLQLLHINYIVIAGFFGLFNKYEWKGRKS